MPDAEAWFDIYFLAYETMVRLNRIDHGLGTTLRAIEDEVGKLRAQGLPRVADLVTGIGLCIVGEEAMQGNESPVPPGWIAPEPGPTASWQEHEVYTLARFYELRADGARDLADALLETALERAAARGLERSRLRFLLARFSAACIDGEDDRARDLLGAAIAIGARTGTRQIFRDMAGPLLATPLARLREEARLDEVGLAFAETLATGCATGRRRRERPVRARARSAAAAGRRRFGQADRPPAGHFRTRRPLSPQKHLQEAGRPRPGLGDCRWQAARIRLTTNPSSAAIRCTIS
jgi:hypothetical protein